ncbi:unnamed protein product [Owenia fusiformis]|uniref:Uncharacterized protein n=1 Tax=Owenia fusiformis TaxID=6347 RepID=A0A8J1TT00_OWEFU|nr:unnamed protein product [Owenia fusiformis]
MSENAKSMKIPKCLLKDEAGIAIDLGGSCIKCAYYQFTSSSDPDEKVDVTCITLPSQDVLESIRKIRIIMDGIPYKWDTYTMNATGFASYKFKTEIIDILGIRDMIPRSEFDICVKGLNIFRDQLSPERYVEEMDKDIVAAAYKSLRDYQLIMSKMMKEKKISSDTINRNNDDLEHNTANHKENTIQSKIPLTDHVDNNNTNIDTNRQREEKHRTVDAENNMHAPTAINGNNQGQGNTNAPYLLVSLGSATSIIKVGSSGSYSIVDGVPRGGRQFISLISLITGAKSFEDVSDMLEKGDHKQVDTLGVDLKKISGNIHQGGDMYSVIPDNATAYAFGNAMWKTSDDFRREDLAVAVLKPLVDDLVGTIINAATTHAVKTVYLTGGFVNQPTIKSFFTKAIVFTSTKKRIKTEFKFIQNGSHLGAFGCLLCV